ncbi:hypothetical protein AMAG_00935 [Allomyces macrogynus ATCC 38327]|uniref:V-SNARE coiled-coil homology domain-containing protein n=1 Tax=Allomyces macrogynus (strain ATCC 38327) TaxID=578462 RepID=A0A0L0RXE8_ALLM3|nr:hypothetical protein AMAG_00935 [Allomyces macrogynus ATCC 38327]|eukprot:KNE54998.1 hypothetical protein AMAG_00935 [Allomyces macrogynus ATCC 38327]
MPSDRSRLLKKYFNADVPDEPAPPTPDVPSPAGLIDDLPTDSAPAFSAFSTRSRHSTFNPPPTLPPRPISPCSIVSSLGTLPPPPYTATRPPTLPPRTRARSPINPLFDPTMSVRAPDAPPPLSTLPRMTSRASTPSPFRSRAGTATRDDDVDERAPLLGSSARIEPPDDDEGEAGLTDEQRAKTRAIWESLNGVAGAVHVRIGQMLARGEDLRTLQAQSDSLTQHSAAFRRQTRDYNAGLRDHFMQRRILLSVVVAIATFGTICWFFMLPQIYGRVVL